ncbi:MAG: TrbC family F-type conjugative pilus assembly protein [Candidatus Methylomirabilota bacterium]
MSDTTIPHRRTPRHGLLMVLIMLGVVGMLGDRAGAEQPEELSPHLYVFISSSLPMGTLIALAKDAAELDAPLILRGLVRHSLQETLLNLKGLVAVGAALEVDPLPFEAYGVEAVPAVVLTCGNRNEGPFAIVYGLDASHALPYLRKLLPRC